MKLSKNLKLFKKLIINYLIHMSKNSTKQMSNKSSRSKTQVTDVSYKDLDVKKFKQGKSIKNPNLNMWEVEYDGGKMRLEAPIVKFQWRGRKFVDTDNWDQKHNLVLPLDDDDKKVASFKKKLQKLDKYLLSQAENFLGDDYEDYTYKPLVTESNDTRPDYHRVKLGKTSTKKQPGESFDELFKRKEKEEKLIAKIYEKTSSEPMKARKDVNDINLLNEFLPYNSEIQFMEEPSVFWAQTKANDEGVKLWGLSWRISFLRRNVEGDDEPLPAPSLKVIKLKDLDPDKLTLTDFDKERESDTQHVAWVRYDDEKFYIDLPPIEAKNYGKTKIVNKDTGEVELPNFYKCPLYPDQQTDEIEILESLKDHVISNLMPKLFGSKKKADKYFLTDIVKYPEENDDDDEEESKPVRPPSLKLALRLEYKTNKVQTKVLDCQDDPDSEGKRVECNTLEEFWSNVKWNDTLQFRVQFNKFYAMKSSSGLPKKRTGLGMKIVQVRKLAEGKGSSTEVSVSNNFLGEEAEVVSEEDELDGENSSEAEEELDNGVASDEDVSEDVSEDASEDKLDEGSDEEEISEDESEEEEVVVKKSTKSKEKTKAAKAKVTKKGKTVKKGRSKKV